MGIFEAFKPKSASEPGHPIESSETAELKLTPEEVEEIQKEIKEKYKSGKIAEAVALEEEHGMFIESFIDSDEAGYEERFKDKVTDALAKGLGSAIENEDKAEISAFNDRFQTSEYRHLIFNETSVITHMIEEEIAKQAAQISEEELRSNEWIAFLMDKFNISPESLALSASYNELLTAFKAENNKN